MNKLDSEHRVTINKSRNTNFDWYMRPTFHKTSCIKIWNTYPSSNQYHLQLVDKTEGKTVTMPISRKQLKKLSTDIERMLAL